MIGLMLVMLMVFFTCDELVLVLRGVGPILRNGCGIWGQNYIALFQENKMSAGLHSRNLILSLKCCSSFLSSKRVILTSPSPSACL